MARPIKAAKKDSQPIGYQSVTVRLPQRLIEALDKVGKGKRAEFIRDAIDATLKQAGIDVADSPDKPSKAK